ncbi:6796_t:CDS:2, partial [Entrophospora sp. SA101]
MSGLDECEKNGIVIEVVNNIIISKPNVEITLDMELRKIGQILHIVENYIVIDSELSGELQVLDSD